jgi:multicomponent K+:H+ antiporter subunit G
MRGIEPSASVALATAFFVLAGAVLTLTGALGLLRFRSFYERVHAPTLGTTCGAASTLIASIIYFSAAQSRPVLHELLIAGFMAVTTPVGLMLLVRAGLYRDRLERNFFRESAHTPSGERRDAISSPRE